MRGWAARGAKSQRTSRDSPVSVQTETIDLVLSSGVGALFFAHLSVRDACALAGVCREFASHRLAHQSRTARLVLAAASAGDAQRLAALRAHLRRATMVHYDLACAADRHFSLWPHLDEATLRVKGAGAVDGLYLPELFARAVRSEKGGVLLALAAHYPFARADVRFENLHCLQRAPREVQLEAAQAFGLREEELSYAPPDGPPHANAGDEACRVLSHMAKRGVGIELYEAPLSASAVLNQHLSEEHVVFVLEQALGAGHVPLAHAVRTRFDIALRDRSLIETTVPQGMLLAARLGRAETLRYYIAELGFDRRETVVKATIFALIYSQHESVRVLAPHFAAVASRSDRTDAAMQMVLNDDDAAARLLAASGVPLTQAVSVEQLVCTGAPKLLALVVRELAPRAAAAALLTSVHQQSLAAQRIVLAERQADLLAFMRESAPEEQPLRQSILEAIVFADAVEVYEALRAAVRMDPVLVICSLRRPRSRLLGAIDAANLVDALRVMVGAFALPTSVRVVSEELRRSIELLARECARRASAALLHPLLRHLIASSNVDGLRELRRHGLPLRPRGPLPYPMTVEMRLALAGRGSPVQLRRRAAGTA